MNVLIAILKLAGPEVARALGLIRRDVTHDHLQLDGFPRRGIWVEDFALTDCRER